MSVADVFREIDALYFQSMEQIQKLESPQSSAETLYAEARTDSVKRTTGFLQKIARLLDVAGLKTQQLPAAQVDGDFLLDRLEVYRSKYGHLRELLRKRQLQSYALESGLIHQQRLRQYEIEESDPGDEHGQKDTGESDSGDENGQKDTLGESRKKLFSGRSARKEPNTSVDDQILQQNKDISSSLRKSKQLMTMSIMQTELNIDTIDQQSQDLRKLNDKLVDLDDLLGKSKQVVRFIEKQDKSDKRRIYLAVAFLVLCSLYVLYRRVLKLPIKIFMWTVFKTFGVLHWVSKTSLAPFENKGTDFEVPGVPKIPEIHVEVPETETQVPQSFSTLEMEPVDLDMPYVQDMEPATSIMTWADSGPEESSRADIADEDLKDPEAITLELPESAENWRIKEDRGGEVYQESERGGVSGIEPQAIDIGPETIHDSSESGETRKGDEGGEETENGEDTNAGETVDLNGPEIELESAPESDPESIPKIVIEIEEPVAESSGNAESAKYSESAENDDGANAGVAEDIESADLANDEYAYDETERVQNDSAEKESAEEERAEKERADIESAEKESAEKESAEKESAEKESAETEHTNSAPERELSISDNAVGGAGQHASMDRSPHEGIPEHIQDEL